MIVSVVKYENLFLCVRQKVENNKKNLGETLRTSSTFVCVSRRNLVHAFLFFSSTAVFNPLPDDKF